MMDTYFKINVADKINHIFIKNNNKNIDDVRKKNYSKVLQKL